MAEEDTSETDSLSSTINQPMSTETSQELNPLRLSNLWDNVPRPMALLSQQVRLRFREEMARKKISHRDVAGILGWSQSRVSHILNGRVEMSIDDVAEFAFAVGLTIVEAVRDRGLEFCAEMTPTELKDFTTYRNANEEDRKAAIRLLRSQEMNQAKFERRALPAKVIKKRSGS